MIRFVDLTSFYWADDTGPACCAFLDTVSDCFVDVGGSHTVDSLTDLELIDTSIRERCAGLIPVDFFGPVAIDVEGVAVTDESRALP